jgi:peptidoglycan L-alanyl-D-glutamate endopeptidase CwlK
MMYKFGKKSNRNLIGVHPILAFVMIEAIKICKVDFGIVEGVRTTKKQRKLVKKGYSKTMNSYHLYGLAVDAVPYVNGKYDWSNKKAFKEIAKTVKKVCKKHGIRCIKNGYDMWGWDYPHWQMNGWRKKYDVRKIIDAEKLTELKRVA